MNVTQIIQRAVKDLYNDPGGNSSLITPQFVVRALNDIILNDYWSVFQDKEYSYFKFSEFVLPIGPAVNTNIYPLPNGDPAQTDDLEFSVAPTTGLFNLKIFQGVSNSWTTALMQAPVTSAVLQNTINAATGSAPRVTVTPTVTGGFLLLWDVSTVVSPILIEVPTNTTGVQINDTTTPANISNLNIAFVTDMRIRTGSYPQYSYSNPVHATNPDNMYSHTNPGPFNFQAPWLTNNNSQAPFSWTFNSGAPDGNGYPTFYIRFLQPPMINSTIVINGLRYPGLLDDGQVYGPIAANVVGTQVPDLPSHFGPILVERVLEQAFIRAGLATEEIVKKIAVSEAKAYAVESAGVSRQNSYGIRRVR